MPDRSEQPKLVFRKHTSQRTPRRIAAERVVALVLAFLSLLSTFGIAPAIASNTITKQLNYQARITNASSIPVADGSLSVKFQIWDSSSGGSCLYTAQGTCGTPTAKTVTVTNGVFSTLIGGSGDNVIPDNLFDTANLWLGVTVSADAEMTPRKQLAAAPYAFNADRLDNLDTSNAGGTGAYVPVTDSSGNLIITGLTKISSQAASPTSNILQLANSIDSLRYLTVSSTSTQVLGGARFIVGSTNTLAIDSSGNFNTINGITTRFPSVQGANSTFLKNDGAGNLTWATAATGSTILNDAYNASTSTSEITLNGTIGGLTVQDTKGGIGANLFEILNSNALGSFTNSLFAVSATSTIINAAGTTGYNVGIGVTSPVAPLEVMANTSFVSSVFDGTIGVGNNTCFNGNFSIAVCGAQNAFFGDGSIMKILFYQGGSALAGKIGVDSNGNMFMSSADGTLNQDILLTPAPGRGVSINTFVTPAAVLAVQDFDTNRGTNLFEVLNDVGTGSWSSRLFGVSATSTQVQGSTFIVGATNTLSINSSGNFTLINGITTRFPSVQGANNTFLKNDGAGNLSWSTVSGASTNLEQAYNNSTSTAEITLNGTIGSLSVQDTKGGTGTNLFEILNSNALGSFTKRLLSVSATSTTINNVAYVFPTAQASAADQVLRNDGSGNLTWVAANSFSTLTNDYNNSTSTSEIALNGTIGSLSVQDTKGGTGQNLFEILNSNALGSFTNRLFAVSATSTTINGISYVYPTAQGAANTILKNNGSGTLSTAFYSIEGAYNSSTSTTELTLNGTQGALSVQDAIGGTGANLLDILNSNALGSFTKRLLSVSATSTTINNVAYVFPTAQASAADQVLRNDGSGNLTWVLGNSFSTLTNDYNNSTSTSEIALNGTIGSLSVQDTKGGTGQNLFEILNSNALGSFTKRLLSVSATSTTINNVAYVFPTAQGGATTELQNDGSGNLSWVTGSSLVNLNQAYNNATGSPQITVNGTQGALTIQDAKGGSGQNLFDIVNSNALGSYTNKYFTVSATAVGVGTASPKAQFDVGGSITSTLGFWSTTPKALISDNFDGTTGVEMKNASTGNSADFRFAISDTQNNYVAFSMPSINNNVATIFGQGRNTIAGMWVNNQAGGNNLRNLVLGTLNAKDDIFGTNSAENMRIQSGGNIGINNSNPGFTLDIKTISAGNPLNIASSAGLNGLLTVLNTGFVGIGPTTPTAKLHITDAAASPTGNILQVANLNDAVRYLTVSSTSTQILGSSRFIVGSTNTLQIDSSGNFNTINGVTARFPAAQGANNTFLKDDGAGNLSWAAVTSSNNLENDYNNSTSTSEITLNGTIGSLSVQDTKGGTGQNLFEILNSNALGSFTKRLFAVSATSTSINNIAYVFPTAQASAADQVLRNDGSGNLTWVLGNSFSTLTNDYNNSTSTSEIALNGTIGSLSIQDTKGGTGTNLFEILDSNALGSFTNRLFTVSTTSTVIGSASSTFALTPNFRVNGSFTPNTDNTFTLGDPALRWKHLYVGPGSVEVGNDTTQTNFAKLQFNGSTAQLFADGATPIQITNGSNPGINVATTGFVGIGIVSPTVALQVADASVSPTGNILQVSNSIDSLRYLTVSSTTTQFTSNIFTIGATNTLSINSSGNFTLINGITTRFPSTQGANNTFLKNDGAGNLSWSTVITSNTLENNYNNSTSTAEITLNGTQGALSVQDAKGGIGQNLLEVLNSNALGSFTSRLFAVSATSTTINNIAYVFPASQGAASTVLQNNGSGTLSWVAASGLTNLTQAYNNATSTTELSLNGTQGGLTIQDTKGGIGQNLIDILDQNATGAYTTRLFSVSATSVGFGNITPSVPYQFGPDTTFGNVTTFGHSAAGNASGITTKDLGTGTQVTMGTFAGGGYLGTLTANSLFFLVGDADRFGVNTGGDFIVGNHVVDNPSAVASRFTVQDEPTNLGYDLLEVLNSNAAGVYTNRLFSVSATSTAVQGNSFTVGATNTLSINSSGNFTIINGVTARFPAAQGANNTFLKNDGAGNLSWASTASGATILNDAYNASTSTSEITLNGTIGGLTVQDNKGGIGQNLLEVLNSNAIGSFTSRLFAVSATSTTINNVAYVFPTSQAGAADQVLRNDGSGNLTWVAGSSLTTLNQAYNNATGTTQLSLNSTRGPLTIADTLGGMATNLFQIQDNANTVKYLTVSATSESLANSLNIGASTNATTNVTVAGAIAQFSVVSSGIFGPSLDFQNTNTGGRDYRFISTGPSDSVGAGRLIIYDNNPGTNRLVLDSTGNFAIGLNSTTARLHVADGAVSPTGNILQVSNSIDSLRYLTVSSTSTQILGGSRFIVGSTNTLAIDSSGNFNTINGITARFPAAQGANNTFLKNDGAGNLSWATVVSANTLENGYNNSTSTAEITLNGTQGSLSVQDTKGGTGQNLFEILNSNASGSFTSRLFAVSATSTTINNVGYVFPTVQATAADQVLRNDGSGNLTWVAGSSLTTLNQAYNNSTSTTEITLNGTQSAFTIQDTKGGTRANLFEILDQNGVGTNTTKYFTVSSTSTTLDVNQVVRFGAGSTSNLYRDSGTGNLATDASLLVRGATIADDTGAITFEAVNNSAASPFRFAPYSGSWAPPSDVNIIDSDSNIAPGVGTNISSLAIVNQFGAFGSSKTFTGSWVGADLSTPFGDGSNSTYNGTAPAVGVRIQPTINVNTASTAGYTDLLINSFETAVSSTARNYLADFQKSGTSRFNVSPGGNIGIDIAAPTSQLHLASIAVSPTGNILQVSNSIDSLRYLTVSSTSTLLVAGEKFAIGSTSPSALATIQDSAANLGTNLFEVLNNISGTLNSRAFTVSSTSTQVPGNRFIVGATNTLVIDSSGNFNTINGITTRFPSAQGANNTFLKDDGAGNLSWSTVSSLTNLEQAYNNSTSTSEITLNGTIGSLSVQDTKGGTGQNLFEILNSNALGSFTSRLFAVSATSTTINGIAYVYPTAQGAANTILKNDGSGNLSTAFYSIEGAYNSSTSTTELTLNGTQGALSIQDAKGGTGANLLDILDSNALGSFTQRLLTVSTTSTSTTNRFTVGATNTLVIDSSGNFNIINGITARFPAAQGANNTFLKNDGSGNLSWSSVTSLTNLTQAYNNSTSTSEIALNGTIGSLSVQDTAGGTGQNLFEILNSNALGSFTSRLFAVSATSTTINGIAYVYPTAQGAANTILKNNGSGTLSTAFYSVEGAYNSSTSTTELTVNGTQGAFTIQDTVGGAGIGANLFDVLNSNALGAFTKRLFSVSATSTTINGVAYVYPTAQGAANTILKNDGSGNLSTAFYSLEGAYNSSTSTTELTVNGTQGALTIQDTVGGAGIGANLFDILNNAANGSFSQRLFSVSATSTSTTNRFTIGATNTLVIDSSGNFNTINGVTTRFPSAQGANNTFLKDDGAGNLSWSTVSSLTNLEQAYNNSTSTSEITLNGTIGSLSVQDTKGGTGTNLFEILNSNALGSFTSRLFAVSATSTTINGVAYVYPTAQGAANTILKNNGSGTLSTAFYSIEGAYNSSTSTTELTLNGTQGALSIQDAIGGTGANLLDILNSNALGSFTNRLFAVSATSTSTTNRFTIGATNTLVIDSSGNFNTINGVTTRFPSAQGANSTVLQNDGAGNLSWATVSGGSTNLNQAYNNSTSTTELTLNGTQGALTIQDTKGGTGANLFEILDQNGVGTNTTKYITVSATGTIFDPNQVIRFGAADGKDLYHDAGTGALVTDAPFYARGAFVSNDSGPLTFESVYSGNFTFAPYSGTWAPFGDINIVNINSNFAPGSGNNVSVLSLTSTFCACGSPVTFTGGSWVGANLSNPFGDGSNATYNGNAPMVEVKIAPTINVNTASTKGYTLLLINPTETSVSSTGPNLLADFQNGGTSRFQVTAAGAIGINDSSPIATLDVNDTNVSPTNNILEIANSIESLRYFTASSTSTQILGGARFIVGSTNTLQIDSSGNFNTINGVTTRFPSTQGSVNTFLKNDGAGNLSWVTVTGGSTNFEQTYNNSTSTTELTLNSTIGGLTIQDSRGQIAGGIASGIQQNLLEILNQNAAGAWTNQLFAVSATSTVINASGTSTYQVGIGTSAPIHTLDVIGDISASQGIRDGMAWLQNQGGVGRLALGYNSGGYGGGATPGNLSLGSGTSTAVFDTTNISSASHGFEGAIFDGRYVYLIPSDNGARFGQITRYDTLATYTSASSWSVFDTTAVNANSKGFIGAAFDGRYIYLAPNANGQVTRYDTTKSFTAVGSYAVFDTVANINASSQAFQGAIFDGRYVYFVPGGTTGKQVTRYDTTAAFTTAGSWSAFDMTTANANAKGFEGAVFDGRYLYFVPSNNGAADGLAARYDTTAGFLTNASWSFFDMTTVNANSKGFETGVFDGRYIYYVPNNAGASGLVTRYDTTGSFSAASSYAVFDTTAVNANSKGFEGAVFDGRFVYLVPGNNGAAFGQVTRYDTTGSFGTASSWSVYDTTAVNANSKAFSGAVFDGHYIYLVPVDNTASAGQVTRITAWTGGVDATPGLDRLARSSNLYIDSSGRAGIGTITPNAQLDLRDQNVAPTANIFSISNSIASLSYLTVNSTSTQVLGGARFIVGSTNTLQIDSSGNFNTINGVTTRFPAAQGANNTFLKNDGAGNLSWSTVSSLTNLEQAYNNSTSTAELTLNGTIGSLSVQDTKGGTGTNLFEILNSNALGSFTSRLFAVSATSTTINGVAYVYPTAQGAANTILKNNGSGTLSTAFYSVEGAYNSSTSTTELTVNGTQGAFTIQDTVGGAGIGANLFDVLNSNALGAFTKRLFSVSATSTTINGVAYIYPTAQGAANTILKNDGAGNLSTAFYSVEGAYNSSTSTTELTVNGTQGAFSVQDAKGGSGANLLEILNSNALGSFTNRLFAVSATSTTINGVAYVYPTAQGAANTILKNNGSGTLSTAFYSIEGAYNSSTSTTELTVNGTQGALTIQDAAGGSGANMLDILDSNALGSFTNRLFSVSATTTQFNSSTLTGTVASITDAAIMTTTGNLLTLTANAATTPTGLLAISATGLTTGSGSALSIASGVGNALNLSSATPKVKLSATDNTAIFTITDASANPLFELRDYATAVQSVASAGAFIPYLSYAGEEFWEDGQFTALTANTLVGDAGSYAYRTTDVSATYSSPRTVNGVARYIYGATTAVGSMLTLSETTANGGAVNAIFKTANLPIMQVKFIPVQTGGTLTTTTDYFIGLMDTTTPPTANDTLPANGVLLWSNNSVPADGGSLTYQGVVRSGSATIGTSVSCTGNYTFGNSIVARIQVESTTVARFLMDFNAGDGINWTDCGTVTGTFPTAALAPEFYGVHNETTARQFDIDYLREWQDDAIGGPSPEAPPAPPAPADSADTPLVRTDLAELFDTKPSDNLSTGDLVTLDATNTFSVVKSTAPYQPTLAGVISENPGLTLTGNDAQNDVGVHLPNGKYVSLAGRVITNVSGENGAIKPGDPITSSSKPGFGMKATKAGRVIGIALTHFDPAIDGPTGTISVLVGATWYNGPDAASGAIVGSSLTVGDHAILDYQGSTINNLASIVSTGNVWSVSADGYMIVKHVDAEEVSTKKLTIRADVTTDQSQRTVGVGTLKAGYNKVLIQNPNIHPDSIILVTFNGNPGSTWWTGEKQDGQFSLDTAVPAPGDVTFSWWVVGVDGALNPTASGSTTPSTGPPPPPAPPPSTPPPSTGSGSSTPPTGSATDTIPT